MQKNFRIPQSNQLQQLSDFTNCRPTTTNSNRYVHRSSMNNDFMKMPLTESVQRPFFTHQNVSQGYNVIQKCDVSKISPIKFSGEMSSLTKTCQQNHKNSKFTKYVKRQSVQYQPSSLSSYLKQITLQESISKPVNAGKQFSSSNIRQMKRNSVCESKLAFSLTQVNKINQLEKQNFQLRETFTSSYGQFKNILNYSRNESRNHPKPANLKYSAVQQRIKTQHDEYLTVKNQVKKQITQPKLGKSPNKLLFTHDDKSLRSSYIPSKLPQNDKKYQYTKSFLSQVQKATQVTEASHNRTPSYLLRQTIGFPHTQTPTFSSLKFSSVNQSTAKYCQSTEERQYPSSIKIQKYSHKISSSPNSPLYKKRSNNNMTFLSVSAVKDVSQFKKQKQQSIQQENIANQGQIIKDEQERQKKLNYNMLKEQRQNIQSIQQVKPIYQKQRNSNSFNQLKTTTIDDFSLGALKGQGRFGKFYPALHKKTGLIVGIKQVKKQSLKYMLDQFIQQLKILSFCNHPNIMKLYGYFSTQQKFYIITQYMQQGSLFSFIKRSKNLSQQQTLVKLKQLCKAIEYLHSNQILHRDIKPQNIVMTCDVCKLCDFGWAVYSNDRRKTYCGTLDYVCPEIIEGDSYDGSVDVWAVGVLAFQMVVGKAPFYNISRQQTMNKIKQCDFQFPNHISDKFKGFVTKALIKDSNQRCTISTLLMDDFMK